MAEKRYVYIVLTQTGTMLSRFIKLLRGAEYNHASISISHTMEPMYSFGRLNPYNPFWGGFVKESVNWGTFKRFYNTTAKILAVEVDSGTYDDIAFMIKKIEADKDNYSYNYLGLILAMFNIHKKYRNSFYCSEFIKEILVKNKIENSKNLPDIIHPIDFMNIPHKIIYTGLLREYEEKEQAVV